MLSDAARQQHLRARHRATADDQRTVVPLNQVATIAQVPTPNEIDRRDRQRVVTVGARHRHGLRPEPGGPRGPGADQAVGAAGRLHGHLRRQRAVAVAGIRRSLLGAGHLDPAGVSADGDPVQLAAGAADHPVRLAGGVWRSADLECAVPLHVQPVLVDWRHPAGRAGDQKRRPARRPHQPQPRTRHGPPARRCWRPARRACAPSS